MKTKLLAFLLILSVLFAKQSFADSTTTSPEKGKIIFTTRCTSCHNVNAQLVGPALADVDKKHTIDWLVSFIRSPKMLIEKKDKDAVALYNQFNQIIMPDHEDITADDVKNVLAYIKSATKTTTQTAPFAKPGKPVPNYHPLSITKNAVFFTSYLVAVIILVLLLIFAAMVKDMQRQKVKQ